MNPNNLNDNDNNEELEYEEEEEEYNYIDPNDIIIIDDPDNWKPDPRFIASYARQLGFNPDKDPKELITIAEKYLTIKLPNNIKRAFTKDNFQILYIDTNTQEIKLRSELEEQASEEFENIRNLFQKQNLPSSKVGGVDKNNNKNKNKKGGNKEKTDDELKKKLEAQKKYMEEEKRKELKKNLILDLNNSEDEKND